MQDESVDLCSIPSRLERLRVATQATWAEIAADMGLSQSMIYQVKSGSRQLSSKAEYRLGIAERKAGLAHSVDQAIREGESQEDVIKAFATASTSEQLSILERDPPLWNLWFEMRLADFTERLGMQTDCAKEVETLAVELGKSGGDKKLLKQLISRARKNAKISREFEDAWDEYSKILTEMATQLRLLRSTKR